MDGDPRGGDNMSFMPSPGSLVRMNDGRIAVVSKAVPDGRDDRVVYTDGVEVRVNAWDIDEIIWEFTVSITGSGSRSRARTSRGDSRSPWTW